MSQDFIPLHQSTPVIKKKKWSGGPSFQQAGQLGSWKQNSGREGNSKRGNHSQRSNSYANNSTSSQGKDKGIDAYLHPSMLQDPWAYLRRKYADILTT